MVAGAKTHVTFPKLLRIVLFTAALCLTACEAGVSAVIPTERPTASPTVESSPTFTPEASPTDAFTPTPAVTGGPTPTPLLGPTRTPDMTAQFQSTRPANPNAPHIEFFRASPAVANPGGDFTLFWSSRNVPQAVIYRLDAAGNRTLVYNVRASGTQRIQLGQNERVQVAYELVIGEGANEVTQQLIIPLACPIAWFFTPPPESCPFRDATQTNIVEQFFERGRLIYVASENRIYALYNDGRTPAWASYQNQYRPGVDPERDDAFDRALADINTAQGTNFVQPVGRLGFLWRGLDNVRNRLGNGTSPELSFDGFYQEAPTRDPANAGRNDIFLASSDAKVIQLLPAGSQWQILTPSANP